MRKLRKMEERFFWQIWAARGTPWSLDTQEEKLRGHTPRWDWPNPHQRWLIPGHLDLQSVTGIEETWSCHTNLPSSPLVLFHNRKNLTFEIFPYWDTYIHQRSSDHARLLSSSLSIYECRVSKWRRRQQSKQTMKKRARVERIITNHQKRWSGWRRGRGSHRHGNGACHQGNGEGSCHRSCRRTWWWRRGRNGAEGKTSRRGCRCQERVRPCLGWRQKWLRFRLQTRERGGEARERRRLIRFLWVGHCRLQSVTLEPPRRYL